MMHVAALPVAAGETPRRESHPTPDTGHLVRAMQLTELAREDGEAWHEALLTVVPPIGLAIKQVAERMGVSAVTARRRYDAWRKNGRNPQSVADRRGQPRNITSILPPETVEYYVGLALGNQRMGCRAAWKRLRREYFSGKQLPGVDPGANRRLLPLGWGYDAFRRAANLNRFEKTAARIGRAAASAYRPGVYRTRVGMHVGERYEWDDMWHDFMVVRVGSRKAMRLLQLSALDTFSGCQFTRGLKPRMEDPETGKRLNLRTEDMLFLVVHVLTDFGYHSGGCTLVVEHGTAALDEATEKLLYDLTGGLIRVVRSGLQRSASFAGQYDLSVGGNFRLKAGLESLHNLIHNETAFAIDFPGQTGGNSRLSLPEELAGREQHLDRLQRAASLLPPEVAAQFRLPFIQEAVAATAVNDIMERINQRTDHDLEGWEEAGLTTVDFEIPGVGLLSGANLLTLPEDRRRAVEAVAVPVARRLSPREVFDAGRAGLVKFRPEQAARLLVGSQGVEVTVRNRMISFQNAAVSRSELMYEGHMWQDGDKFRVVVNPYNQAVAHLFDARGRWIGTTKQIARIRHGDEEAYNDRVKDVARMERHELARVVRTGGELSRRRMDDARHNIRNVRDHAAATAATAEDAYAALEAAVD